MLKKQTIWLLTMVSLMIVLSVYYMMSDKQDVAYINKLENKEDKVVTVQTPEDMTIDDVNSLHGSQIFTSLRMEVQDQRNMKKDRLRDVVKSNDASVNEINDALNEITLIESIETKETILQGTILSTDKSYNDVLVRAEEDKVHVHVIADEHSKEAAAHIMQMVIDELGNVTVDVNFQPVNG